ncbi:uncharacterized protein LOC131596740 [Vicia villosa]|uniref:uncharacterized protein LOC131596740 n=1 Tax=Vicia villosa TaxID=3911 RepID=UPI00273B69ED|nr:uncharacterized protein LOC131596740 [Vicia villosa]
MGSWNGEIWRWNFGTFGETEDGTAAAQLNQLVILLASVQPCRLIEDSFVWWRNPSGFTVSNAYDTILLLDLPHPPLENSLSSIFSCLWKTKVPSRIHLFGWRLIWNRLPTKAELAKRGILVEAQLLKCPLCNRVDEDLDHLFLHCHYTRTWWTELYSWLGIDEVPLVGTILERLSSLDSICKSSFHMEIGWFFGLTFCWVVWKCRNAIIFEEICLASFDGVGLFKLISWEWFLIFFKEKASCSWPDWCVDPRPFLN